MFKLKILFFYLFFSVLTPNSLLFANESITITTYYPSPFGIYNELRVKKLGIGETWYDSSVYPIVDPTDLIIEGNVAIGTTNPTHNFEVWDGESYFRSTGTNAVTAQTTDSNSIAVYGENTAGGRGIYGVGTIAVSGNGTIYGIQGESDNGTGVRGRNINNNSNGVYGQGVNGVYGVGTITGIYGSGANGIYGLGTTTGVYGDGAVYDFYAGGAGTNYASFTGSHEVKLAPGFQKDIKKGLVVSLTGKVEKRKDKNGIVSISSTLPTVKLSNKPRDSAVLGVLTSETSLPQNHWYKIKDGERFGMVNALGEGRVLVTNINGEIQTGDYITTSNIPGYGQKQGDDLLHSYTLGKAIETFNWDKVTKTIEFNGKEYNVYLIGVIYTSG